MKTILTICLLSFISLSTALSQCDPYQDSLALVALYNSTDGPNWKKNSNWLVPGVPIWQWYGVDADPAIGCVECLDLDGEADCIRAWAGGNGLDGTLPPELGNLTSIKFLNFSFNYKPNGPSLVGYLPPELGNLSTLEYLYLGDCLLTGPIPPEFGNLTNLKELQIDRNRYFESVIPPELGNLVNLEKLILSDYLSGPLPPELGNLSNLEYLAICGNLTGEIPQEIGNLTNLKVLKLWCNDFENIPSELGNLTKLEELNISGNNLTGEIPPELGQLIQLKKLDLSLNQLTRMPPELGNLNNLETLSLGQNNFIGGIPPELGNLENLTSLFLGAANLDGSIPPELGNLNNLQTLGLNQNSFIGNIPPELGNLTALTYLSLNNNKLTGAIPPELGNLQNLTALYFQNNKLSGSIPPELSNLNNLQILDLANNQLSGQLPPELANMNGLYQLLLSKNHLTGTIPSTYGSFNNLNTLNLSNNQLTGSIPSEIGGMNNIGNLYLSNNQFEGDLPTEFESKWFFNLGLENNRFTFQNLENVFDIQISGDLIVSPQKPFFKDTTYYVQSGNSLEINLEIDADLTDNEYKWTKNGSSFSVNNPNSNILLLPNLQVSDAGIYQTTVTNPQFVVLELESHPIQVKVCDVASDSLQLVALYNATGGNGWDVSVNWLQANKPFDTWYGITTDQYGCVNQIDLSNNNLTGTLPTLNLNTLETLNLSENEIGGAIPVFNMPSLHHLDLSDNSFDGEIPALFTPLVQQLDFSGNNLSGTILEEIGRWVDLEVLNLGNNSLSGLVPNEIGDLTGLKELRLNDNDFQGELPVELTELRNLEIGRVDFSNNNINSLQETYAYFCPYGTTILENNPSHAQFINICEGLCTGDEWNSLHDYPWILDTLSSISCFGDQCHISFALAGFVEVRGITFFFTRTTCVWVDTYSFYDCNGNLIESIVCDFNNVCTGFGTISEAEFCNLLYDIRWGCGQDLPIISSDEEIFPFDNQHQEGELVQLSVFPNPTQFEVSFFNQPDMDLEQLQCTNLLGQAISVQVQSNSVMTNLRLDTDIPGMYWLSVPGEKRVYVAKILKQK